MKKSFATLLLAASAISASAPPVLAAGTAKNVIFFLGDGMGPTVVTAARIYKYGEDGQLTMEGLRRTARVVTYSNDAMTTDSAPSMAAYMTGVKMNNEVLSMTPETRAYDSANAPYVSGADSTCPASANGFAVPTLLEMAKAHKLAVGVVTTTRVTHATPAATYAHVCHRDGENTIAAQLIPGGAGFNAALGTGVDVVLGGGRKHFLPNTVTGGARTDGRDLTAEAVSAGYAYVSDKAGLMAVDAASTSKLIGLFTGSHMAFETDRNAANEPSLSEMTGKAIDMLKKNTNGYFLMVEGGRIDHALHETNALRALNEAVEFDNAINLALSKVDLKDTLVVVTADHDHTMTINGYGKRTGATTARNAGILGLVKHVVTGALVNDADGVPYTNLVFGNGENRVAGARSSVAALDEATTSAVGYHQEAGVRMAAGGETHGGGDVMLMADGAGASTLGFKGTMVNTRVFSLIRNAFGF